jgi:hypothetical protein
MLHRRAKSPAVLFLGYRTNSRIALSSPSSVSGYIRPPISWRTIWIE